MADNSINTRALVADILTEIDKNMAKSHLLVREVLDKYDYLGREDKSFIKRVTVGTLEQRIRIDYVIERFSNTPVGKMKPFIRSVIRMSTYQLLYMDKIPDSAVVNEAVKLVAKRGFGGLRGFVNGLLRTISRSKAGIEYPADDTIKGMSINYSCPEIIVSSMVNDYGMDLTKVSLDASVREHVNYARLASGLQDSQLQAILQEWDENNIDYEMDEDIPNLFRIGGNKFADLKGFLGGLYTIQDKSSAMVFKDIVFPENCVVLDVCAAPGGKACHAADLLGGRGRVIARDVSESKVMLIRENKERLKLDNIEAEFFDACDMDPSMEGAADVVILDVPCSGFGVIGRKPDIKYAVNEEGLAALVELQRRIIDNAVRYVKPGGQLLYSTCTMRKAENEENVDYILGLPGTGLSLKYSKTIMLSDKQDGFFIARFVREG